jgi:hypothetical protein
VRYPDEEDEMSVSWEKPIVMRVIDPVVVISQLATFREEFASIADAEAKAASLDLPREWVTITDLRQPVEKIPSGGAFLDRSGHEWRIDRTDRFGSGPMVRRIDRPETGWAQGPPEGTIVLRTE